MTTYITMGDSTTPASIPKTVDRVAGYTTGKWPTYWLLDSLFPGKPKFAFAIAADQWGDALDIERLDATIDQAPGWAANVWRPVNVVKPNLYINAANVQNLVDTMTAAGWARDDYVVGSAHYWGPLHVCGPGSCNQTGGTAEADWTQWASYPGYDLSTIPTTVFTGDDPMPLTSDDATLVANAVILQMRQQETPGGELSDREKALIQNAIQALVPADIAAALANLKIPGCAVDPAVIQAAVADALNAWTQKLIAALESADPAPTT
jgi:hypothetical protein